MAGTPVILNATDDTYTKRIDGKYILHTKGTFGGGSLIAKLNGEAMENGTFSSNVTKEINCAGEIELVLAGATAVTVYFDKISQR